MARFAIAIALIAGCDYGQMRAGDAAPATDADARGIVRVRVTGWVERGGLHVIFQERDSSLSLSTQTDANGEVTGRLGPNGFVTLVAGHEPALTLWTYTNVQPGDELEFYEPDVVDVTTPSDSISVFAPGAGEPPFTLRTTCGGSQIIVDALPVAMPISACGPVADFLLERGQVYRYAKDVVLADRRIDFDGEFADYATSTITVTNVPGRGWITQSLIGHGAELARTSNVSSAVDGSLRVVLGLPLPPDATMVTHVDLDDLSAQHIVDWRPAASDLNIDYDEILVAGASRAPFYDPTTRSIQWSDGRGTPGDLVRATLHWLDGQRSRTRSWVVIGPRGEDAAISLPYVPIPDLVPSVDAPQTIESLVTGEQREWLRQHLHGRWLPQGVTWPTNGPSGRVVWRSL